MDGLDGFDIGESGGAVSEWGSEAAREASEKQREASSKAFAGIQKSRKDESKARKHSNDLARVIASLLRDPVFDAVTDILVFLLKQNAPAALVLSLACLVHADARSVLSQHLGLCFSELPPSSRETEETFREDSLDPAERNRINEWVEAIFAALTKDVSVILTKKLMASLDSPVRDAYVESMAGIFRIFLMQRRVGISTSRATAYAEFVFEQIELRLRSEKLEEF